MTLARTAALLCTLCLVIGCDKKADPPAPSNVAVAQPKSTSEVQAAATAASSADAAKKEAATRLATARAQVKFESINFVNYGGDNLCEPLKLPQWVACRSAVKDGHPGDADACALVAGANGCKPEPQKQVTWCCPLGKL